MVKRKEKINLQNATGLGEKIQDRRPVHSRVHVDPGQLTTWALAERLALTLQNITGPRASSICFAPGRGGAANGKGALAGGCAHLISALYTAHLCGRHPSNQLSEGHVQHGLSGIPTPGYLSTMLGAREKGLSGCKIMDQRVLDDLGGPNLTT